MSFILQNRQHLDQISFYMCYDVLCPLDCTLALISAMCSGPNEITLQAVVFYLRLMLWHKPRTQKIQNKAEVTGQRLGN